MSFFDFLVQNNIDLGSFGWLVVGVCFGMYFIAWILPQLIWLIIGFFLTLFGFINDIQLDKFMWSRNDFIFRTVMNLYDENGICKKTPFYNTKVKNYRKRHKL